MDMPIGSDSDAFERWRLIEEGQSPLMNQIV